MNVRSYSPRAFLFRALCSILVVAGVAAANPTAAAHVCGDANGDGEIRSSDARVALQVAVGVGQCPLPCCDANQSGTITASDAMAILRSAVGIEVVLNCPPDPDVTTSTTTSITTSTTLLAACGNGEVEDGEDCDPPDAFCRGGCNPVTGLCVDFMCSHECSCPKPLCGDAMVDPGEACDPPGSECEGGTCGQSCECEP